MKNLEYHKGSFCIYKPIFCQEGYCSGCEIRLEKAFSNESKEGSIGTLKQVVASNRSDTHLGQEKQGSGLATLTRNSL
jgi:hypothetical protein